MEFFMPAQPPFVHRDLHVQQFAGGELLINMQIFSEEALLIFFLDNNLNIGEMEFFAILLFKYEK